MPWHLKTCTNPTLLYSGDITQQSDPDCSNGPLNIAKNFARPRLTTNWGVVGGCCGQTWGSRTVRSRAAKPNQQWWAGLTFFPNGSEKRKREKWRGVPLTFNCILRRKYCSNQFFFFTEDYISFDMRGQWTRHTKSDHLGEHKFQPWDKPIHCLQKMCWLRLQVW